MCRSTTHYVGVPRVAAGCWQRYVFRSRVLLGIPTEKLQVVGQVGALLFFVFFLIYSVYSLPRTGRLARTNESLSYKVDLPTSSCDCGSYMLGPDELIYASNIALYLCLRVPGTLQGGLLSIVRSRSSISDTIESFFAALLALVTALSAKGR